MRASRNLNKDGLFSLKPHNTSDLAFSDSFVFFRPFASVFGFCQRDVTQNVTRRDRLSVLFVGTLQATPAFLLPVRFQFGPPTTSY
jgi:hypothetical protein